MQIQHQQSQFIEKDSRLQMHRISSSSTTSMSSGIFTMCPLDISSDNFSSLDENKRKISASSSDSISSVDRKKLIYKEKTTFIQRKFLRTMESSDDDTDQVSIISADSCLRQLILCPKLRDDTTIIMSSPSKPIGVQLTPECICRLKLRQDGLDQAAQELINLFRDQANEKIKEISKIWSYIQTNLLEKYKSKTNLYQFVECFFQSSLFNSQYQTFLDQNTDLSTSILILIKTLPFVHKETSICSIEKTFLTEETTTLEDLHEQIVHLTSSYIDALSFIRARCNFYQSNPTDEYNAHWIQVLQNDYSELIEKISDDFISKMPQIQSILLQMLKNVKKNLLQTYST